MRDDDNEYDVQYEDGTIFTIKAKDVKKRSIADDKTAKKATPSRSRCVGNWFHLQNQFYCENIDTGTPAYSDSVGTAKKCHCKRNVTVTGIFSIRRSFY